MKAMKIRIATLLFALLLCGGAAHSQTVRPADFRASLADPVNGSRVTVTMSPQLSAMLDRPQTLDGKEVAGYRVYIYNENHQNAGAEARQTESRFRSLFPDIPVEIIKRRDDSYWKVAVGNCLSKDEQMMIFGRVKGTFGSAYTFALEPLPLRNFLTPQVIAPAEPE